jgi:transglutaminase-like putative cysteine protease
MIILNFIGWIIRRVGGVNLLTLLLLLFALNSLVWTIAEMVRGLNLWLLIPITVASLLLGWLLACLTPVPWWLAGLLIFGLGSEALIIRTGRFEGVLFSLGQNLLYLLWQFWRWPLDGPPQLVPLGQGLAQLGQGLNTLLARLLTWAISLAGPKPVFDPVATTLVWNLVLWLICGWTGWATRRLAQPLAAMAPAGILLSTLLAYRPSLATNLLPLLGVTLLLLGLTGHQARERQWQAQNVDFASDLRTDLSFAIIPLTLILVLVAGITPSISIREITRLFQPLQRQEERAEPLVDSFGLETRPEEEPVALAEFRSPGLPRRHLLGSGPELSQQVAMLINTGQTPIPYEAASSFDYLVPRYYWRSLTYDRYTGHGWRTSETEPQPFEASEPAAGAVSELWRVLRQKVTLRSNQGGRLHMTGDLVTADHDFIIEQREPGDIFAVIIEAREYQVDGLIPITPFTEDELRAAGSAYPDWIAESHYLILPEDVPERVLSLALDLTATAPTPYDRAKAIETYLRQFPYSLDLPEPPVSRDVVDYFLFDLQQGYCDYYATSMVVLARAAGLPARLVVGYASGGYDPASAQYVVTEADAHSWVEVYFPNYGWIEFEPTAARPVIDRSTPVDSPDFTAQPLPPLEPAEPEILEWASSWWFLVLAGPLLVLVSLSAWLLADRWRLGRLSPTAAVALLYERLRRHGQRLAVPAWGGETPYEFTEALSGRVETLAREKRWRALLTPAVRELRWLADLYVRTSYSPHPPDSTEQSRAIQTWQRLRQRLWLAWLSTLVARVKRERSRE